jgi:hypothetical protein
MADNDHMTAEQINRAAQASHSASVKQQVMEQAKAVLERRGFRVTIVEPTGK